MSAARRTIGILAVTQIASWGALYYAFAVLAPDIRRDLGITAETAFAAYSWSLLVSGIAATPDRCCCRWPCSAAGWLHCWARQDRKAA